MVSIPKTWKIEKIDKIISKPPEKTFKVGDLVHFMFKGYDSLGRVAKVCFKTLKVESVESFISSL